MTTPPRTTDSQPDVAALVERLRTQAEYARTHAMPATSKLHKQSAATITRLAQERDEALAVRDAERREQDAWLQRNTRAIAARAEAAEKERDEARAKSSDSQPEDFPPEHANEDGWSDWIHPLAGYRMKCCDCGLIHGIEFRIDDANQLNFRMRRESKPENVPALVERLRAQYVNGAPHWPGGLFAEAADTITRLAEENERLKSRLVELEYRGGLEGEDGDR